MATTRVSTLGTHCYIYIYIRVYTHLQCPDSTCTVHTESRIGEDLRGLGCEWGGRVRALGSIPHEEYKRHSFPTPRLAHAS